MATKPLDPASAMALAGHRGIARGKKGQGWIEGIETIPSVQKFILRAGHGAENQGMAPGRVMEEEQLGSRGAVADGPPTMQLQGSRVAAICEQGSDLIPPTTHAHALTHCEWVNPTTTWAMAGRDEISAGRRVSSPMKRPSG